MRLLPLPEESRRRAPVLKRFLTYLLLWLLVFAILVKCYVYTHAVIENEIWGSLKTNFKVFIDDIFASIPKMVLTHYNFVLDKVD